MPPSVKLMLPDSGQDARAFPANRPPVFLAIDFETADRFPDSACSVGLVRVENGRIAERKSRLIRPPRDQFEFTRIHGITWDLVAGEDEFGRVWRDLESLLQGVHFLVAHNAPFDQRVLAACCRSAGTRPPSLPFFCTMRLARKVWGISPTRLPDVCARLGVRLQHHDALSDAEACAHIMIAVLEADTLRLPADKPA